MYKVWCEWDMGEDWDDVVFKTKEDAIQSINGADWDMVGMTVEDVLDDGLVGIREVEVQ